MVMAVDDYERPLWGGDGVDDYKGRCGMEMAVDDYERPAWGGDGVDDYERQMGDWGWVWWGFFLGGGGGTIKGRSGVGTVRV